MKVNELVDLFERRPVLLDSYEPERYQVTGAEYDRACVEAGERLKVKRDRQAAAELRLTTITRIKMAQYQRDRLEVEIADLEAAGQPHTADQIRRTKLTEQLLRIEKETARLERITSNKRELRRLLAEVGT